MSSNICTCRSMHSDQRHDRVTILSMQFTLFCFLRIKIFITYLWICHSLSVAESYSDGTPCCLGGGRARGGGSGGGCNHNFPEDCQVRIALGPKLSKFNVHWQEVPGETAEKELCLFWAWAQGVGEINKVQIKRWLEANQMIMMFPVRLVLEEAAATRSVRDEDQAATTWMLVEPAVDPSTHPCLATMASLPRPRYRWVGGCPFVLGNDATYYEVRWNRWVRSARRSSVLSPAASSRGKQGSGRKILPGTDQESNKQGLHITRKSKFSGIIS